MLINKHPTIKHFVTHHAFSYHRNTSPFSEEMLNLFYGKYVITAHASTKHLIALTTYYKFFQYTVRRLGLGYEIEDCAFLFIVKDDMNAYDFNKLRTALTEDDSISNIDAKRLAISFYCEGETEEAFKHLLNHQNQFGYRWKGHFKVGPANILVPGADKVIQNGGEVVSF